MIFNAFYAAMTSHPHAFLRLVDIEGHSSAPQRYHLSPIQATEIGRDPYCQIILNSQRYGIVSRRHVGIYPHDTGHSWEIADLGSANGTFINGNRLTGSQRLRTGDRFMLGQNGPEFVFELEFPSTPPSNPVTFTQLFPIFSTGQDLTRKAYLIPASLTAIVVVLLFLVQQAPGLFNVILGSYLAGIAYYYVYQLCGKHKPAWLLCGCALFTAVFAVPCVKVFGGFFYGILTGSIPDLNFFTTLLKETLGTGLLEELIKILPVLLLWAWSCFHSSVPLKTRLGLIEPLDGIVLATASAVGFILIETLGFYVPTTIQSAAGAATAAGHLAGLQLLIPRVLGSVSGHMAYSGYLGYFVGLSLLKPYQRWKILATGYISSACLHGLWNATSTYLFNQVSPLAGFISLALIGVLSYAFLAAAILKARALSPTRSENFATRFR